MEKEKDANRKKVFTKERVILFVIGMLTGAIIATSAFFIYVNVAGVNINGSNQSAQMPGETPPEMPEGETPPEMPEGEPTNSESSSSESSSSENNATSETSTNNGATTGQNTQNSSNRSQPPAKPSEKKTKDTTE